MERRLAAILAADAVGYSKLMADDEEGTLAQLKAHRTDLFDPKVAEYNGRIVKLIGDGALVEFSSVFDAVNCAVAIQSALAEANGVIQLRIGINIGDIIFDDNDIYGDGVNIAARLEAAGAPGYVIISDNVHRQVSGRVNHVFQDIGLMELKNIPEPVRVWSWPKVLPDHIHESLKGRKPSVHVAQFNARGTMADELANAIRDDLATTFARQSGINLVVDQQTADFVVTGAIRVVGDQWRISANLTDLINDHMIWSERFEETGDDVFSIQDSCVTRISGAVRVRLPSLLGSRLAKRSFEEMNSDDLLNFAMNRHFTQTLESWDQAGPALEQVLERDSDNWMAMTMLAFNSFSRARIFGWKSTDQTSAQTAHQLIASAQTLKPDSEVLRMVSGAYLLHVEHDHASAHIEAEQSLRLNPNFYHSINLMSQVELFSGNLERAMELALRAADCDPAYPYSHLYQRDLGYVYAVSGRYSEAMECFSRANQAVSELPQNLVGIAISAQLAGRVELAKKAVQSLLALQVDFNIADYEPWSFQNPADWKPFQEALAEAMSA